MAMKFSERFLPGLRNLHRDHLVTSYLFNGSKCKVGKARLIPSTDTKQ
jgi:hypothetical protein